MRPTAPTNSSTGSSRSAGGSREPVGTPIPWTRLTYFAHRWIGTGLGGEVLSPLSPGLAEAAAREIVGTGPRVAGIDLLRRGDRYMMNGDYAAEFPAYRVRFDDVPQTAVYVNRRGSTPFAVVTRLTRLTTWTGTVPHWLYFRWLYDRYPVWNWSIILIGSCGVLLGLTGI